MKKKTIGIFVVGMMLSLCGAATGQQDTPAAGLGLNQPIDSGDRFPARDTGKGFMMKGGYTVVWRGWKADIPSISPLLKANLPVETRDGKPIVGTSREEFTDVPAGPVFTQTLTYPAASLDPSGATLTVREREADPRKPLPASSWHFVDARHVEITAAPGFDHRALY